MKSAEKLLKAIYVIIGVLSIFLVYLFFVAYSSQTYESDNYSFEYPNSHSVHHENNLLIVEGENGRVEIFKKSDFDERIHGFSSSGLEEFEKELVPKEKHEVDGYEIWFFYEEGDIVAQGELQRIINTFKIS